MSCPRSVAWGAYKSANFPILLRIDVDMLFSPLAFAEISLLISTVVAVPSRIPFDPSKRADATDISAAFVGLKAKFDAVASSISSAVSSGNGDANAITAAVEPILTNSTQTSKPSQPILVFRKVKWGSPNGKIRRILPPLQRILPMPLPLVTALGPLSSAIAQIPVLGTLLGPFLSDVDVDLGIVLTGVGIVLDGVVALVSDLLSSLGSALSGLGLSSVVSTLGL